MHGYMTQIRVQSYKVVTYKSDFARIVYNYSHLDVMTREHHLGSQRF